MPITLLDREPVTMSRRDLVKGLAAGYVVALTGCVQNTALGRQQLILVSEGQLAQLSASAWTEIKRKEKLSRDPGHNKRVQAVGSNIVKAAGMDRQSWEYAVFEDKQANAFVLPGGKVGVNTGILQRMDNDDQLATVLGHETGHVTARHSAERYSQQLAAGVAMTAAAVALEQGDVGGAPQIAAVLGAGLTFGVLLPYSRQHELEADRIGVDYMARAGYDPRESLRFWQNMSSTREGTPPPEFMSTHPSDETRIAAIRGQLRAMGYQV